MNRLLAALRLDFLMQRRYGFLYAGTFSTLVWIALLKALPHNVLAVAVPIVVFFDLAIIGFYFIAGMVLFEKGERTLFALVVTPLRFWEYFASKLIGFTLLAAIASIVLIVVTYGVALNISLGILGIILMSLISLIIGFIAVSPFKSLSSYLIPSQVYALLLYLPIIYYFGWWESPLFYLLPTQGALLLLQGAFQSIQLWQVLYALLSGIIWVGLLTLIANRVFNRYIVARQGEK